MRLWLVALVAACATVPARPVETRDESLRGRHPLPPPRDPNAPRDALDKSDIVIGMRSVTPAVMACYDRFHGAGFYVAEVTLGGSGRVEHVTVSGPNTNQNECIGAAVATATFPTFTGPRMVFRYPYMTR